LDQNKIKKVYKLLDDANLLYPKTSHYLYKKAAVQFRLNCTEDAFITLNKAMDVSFTDNALLFEYAPELEESRVIKSFINQFKNLKVS
jgi:hypothetical protein